MFKMTIFKDQKNILRKKSEYKNLIEYDKNMYMFS